MSSRPSSLGAVIRAQRKKAGRTLQDVARQAEFSISYLSQIERNLLTPSVSTLKRIADVLEIPAGQLMFTGAHNEPLSSLVALVRRKERKQLSFPGSNIHYELMTPDMRRRSSLLWVTAPPGSDSGVVNRRATLTPDRRAILTPSIGDATRNRGAAAQLRCLRRQLSLPVSTMSQWCVRRSSSAVVIFASPKTEAHSANARLVVTMIEVRS